MKRGQVWPIVAKRELYVRITDKNFVISTVVMLGLLAAVFGVQAFLETRGSTTTVAVSSPRGAELAGLVGKAVTEENEKDKVEVRQVATDDEARQLVASEDADVWLHQADSGWAVTTKNEPADDGFTGQLEKAAISDALQRNAASFGTTPEAMLAGTTVASDQLEGSSEESMARSIAAAVLAFVFYLVSLLFGIAIAQSVIEEKQSRIVEIIASAIPLRQLLVGKVVGATLLAAGQMVLFVLVSVVGLQFSPYRDMLGGLTGPLGWYLAFFVVGFVALACLWAAAGALASRSEDLQTTSQPLQMTIMLAFFGSAFASGRVEEVLSFLPITSCLAMPARLLQGSVPIWQPAVALLINVLFAALAVRFGERAYRRSVMDSGRVSWRKALASS